MILLDTNVLSEFMRPQPSGQVVAWLDKQLPDEIWTSAISRAEIELGLALMPEGKRRENLNQAMQIMFNEDFAGRCLPFDEIAASYYGRIVSARIQKGLPSAWKMPRSPRLRWHIKCFCLHATLQILRTSLA